MKATINANQENQNQKTKTKTRNGKRSVSDMASPGKAPVTRKRTAFGDITNVSVVIFRIRDITTGNLKRKKANFCM